MTTSAERSEASPVRSRRALLAGSVGNFVEWYEFGVYGYFATIIAANFFTPEGGSDVEALVKTYASFALAFFFRPVGAALFGRIGDRIGRRPTLILVIGLMTLATTLIGLLPTYATVGALAPWLLTLLRILQGLSAGGEFGGAVSLMTEFAPPGRRGLYGSWQSFTVALGLLGGAGAAALLATVLSEAALVDWGWRLPFLLTLPLGAVALWLRLRLEETPRFREAEAAPAAPPPTGEVVRAIVLGAGRIMGWAAAGYTFQVVLPSYLQSSLNASFREALIATVLANLGFAASIIPAGLVSDRVGRRPVMLTGAALVVLLALPLMNLLQDEGASAAAKGAAVLAAGAVVGLLAGPGPAMLAEMFPTSVRCTGLGLAYALSNAVFSGCAGLVITELIKRTGSVDIPAYYAAATCAVSVFALLTLRGDDHRRPLR
ncbi:integral membrane transporter [Streptomyces pristinaespiralis ATCC 25486]|uniref:Putative proline/betaine transporter n=1 Tax=Streptomyces pristinaespiralis (strain ATCC 25486 / DSM 40338 / CBS 914.69 / JCM 4507 / KCC S-0507 / NBRC 13074 / NRRL 2958 / 5647) TaxID=457429 RepID=B5HAD9_STRE2|nr:MFS transporter [Streptomyces pristinaespiralis]EDY63800.2 integral membrane transporter [Streptomyces pristinaespiralis ATCC 25486]